MKPHNHHAPGLPSATNGLIIKAARRMHQHVEQELAAESKRGTAGEKK